MDRFAASLSGNGVGAWSARALACIAGSLLLWASAKVHVPFWPVPMTMQTGVVVLLAALYGPRLGVATVVLYLLQGAIGLPVFSGTPERGIGLAYMAGPTGGYLIGFAVAAALVAWLLSKAPSRSFPVILGAMALGMVTIYACGVTWLATLIGWEKAVAAGVMPFVLGDALKCVLAALVAWRFSAWTRRLV